eukprot:1156823-Pelagomonas_calceolata.AAC.2
MYTRVLVHSCPVKKIYEPVHHIYRQNDPYFPRLVESATTGRARNGQEEHGMALVNCLVVYIR